MAAQTNNTKISVGQAVAHGDLWTRLSMLFMGAGLFGHGQKIKGALVFALELIFVLFMVNFGIGQLSQLVSLGDNPGGEVFNEALGIFEYTKGDNSLLILLYCVATLFVIAALLLAATLVYAKRAKEKGGSDEK